MKSIEEIKNGTKKLHDQALTSIERFSAKLKDDPVYALEWSEQAFSAAGVLSITRWLLPALEKPDVSLDNIVKILRDNLRHGTRHPARSTSVPSNLLAQDSLYAASILLTDVFGVEF